MKILSFGTDSSILDTGSPLAERIRDYGRLVERYDVLVVCSRSSHIELGSNISVSGVGGNRKAEIFFRFLFRAYSVARKGKYDVITVQDPYFLSLIGLILSRMFRIGLHVQIHGWEKFGGLRAVLAKFVLRRADAVRTVSERLKTQLSDGFGVDRAKITVVPMHVWMPKRETAEKIGRKDRFVFLTVGRLVIVKNIRMQLRAMKRLSEISGDRFRQVELWIAGDGPDKEEYLRICNEFGLADKIRFLGRRSKAELDEIYRQADVFMLTSFAEGWPLVIIEAASFGLPIIMTDVGSAGEFLRDGENGLIVPVDDDESLAAAMVRLFEDQDLRERLGVNAKRSAEGLPDYETILQLYLKSWNDALKKR